MKDSRQQHWLLRLPQSWVGWVLSGLCLVVLICLAGGLIGTVLYPLGGLLFGKELTLLRMMRYGFMDGAFLALIWAPGLSIVACFAGAHEKARLIRKLNGNDLDIND